MRMACRCGPVLLLTVVSLPASAQPPDDPHRAGEVTIQAVTFAEARTAQLARDPKLWARMRHEHRDRLGIDLDSEGDRTRFGSARDLVLAHRTVFGDLVMQGLGHSFYSARLNDSGGDILMEGQVVKRIINADGQSASILPGERRDILGGWKTDAAGRSQGPDFIGPALTLDPKHDRSVSIDIQTRMGVGLYQGQPITGNRAGAFRSAAGAWDGFSSLNPGEIAKQIAWLGPVKTYRAHYFLDNEGNWEWKEEMLGIDRKGKIPPD